MSETDAIKEALYIPPKRVSILGSNICSGTVKSQWHNREVCKFTGDEKSLKCVKVEINRFFAT